MKLFFIRNRSGGPLYAEQAAIQHDVLLIRLLLVEETAVNGIWALRQKELQVRSLQAHHGVVG